MRRADRLFRLVQHLRSGRLQTAAQIAEAMEVSERTIYRDIADLQASGVPIDGARGVGYIMRRGFDLPPLMFNNDEISALVLGARLVAAWGGRAMADAAGDALSKIATVLPKKDAADEARQRFSAPGFYLGDKQRALLDMIDAAARARTYLQLEYRSGDAVSHRKIRPLALWFWGAKWTFIAWCELRDDFRMFRTDRIENLIDLDEIFAEEDDKTLAAYIARHTKDESFHIPPDPLSDW